MPPKPKAHKGNSCLLCLKRMADLLLIVVSLGWLAIGIYLTLETKDCGLFEMTFIVLGLIEIFLVFYSFCKASSKGAMSCYIYIMTMVVGFQAITAVVAVIFKDKIAEWAADSQNTQDYKKLEEEIEKNITWALYAAIGASGV
mmetsp:Transcript_31989/g.28983  ORF Transcript_31989/g.28983 Transcript_31989/m.28983 type:complete len:143 (-) Transcript_31989:405-833(-)